MDFIRLDIRRFLDLVIRGRVSYGIRGARCECPLHPDVGESMSVHVDPVTGVATFKCNDKSCGFHGGPVALLSAITRKPETTIIREFGQDGKYSRCLIEPIRDCDIDAFITGANMQARVKAYLSACSSALRSAPEKSRLRPGLSQSSMRSLPVEMGMMTFNDDTPSVFSDFRKLKNSTLIVCPYTRGGSVSCVDVYDTSAQDTFTRVDIDGSGRGVFMGGFEKCPPELVVSPDPVTAALLYGGASMMSAIKPPVVGIAGFPLPSEFSQVASIAVATSKDRPLSLKSMLSMVSKSDGLYVEGATSQPRVIVWETRKRSGEVSADDMRRAFKVQGPTMPLYRWIVSRLMDLYEDGGSVAVSEALSESKANPTVIAILSKEARHMADMYPKARQRYLNLSADIDGYVSSDASDADISMMLGNGKAIRSGSYEIDGIGTGGRLIPLSNFGMKVIGRITGPSGESVCCDISTTTDGSARVVIPGSSWGSRGRMIGDIADAFSELGKSPYIASYNADGYSWEDIIRRLSAGCVVREETDRLGMGRHGEIHFPGFVIRGESVEDQMQLGSMPDRVKACYANVRGFDGVPDMEVAKEMLGSLPPYVVLQICHIVYQATYCKGMPTSAYAPRKHLFVVDGDIGCAAVNRMISGSDLLLQIPRYYSKEFLSTYSGLGTLPMLAYMTLPDVEHDGRRRSDPDEIELASFRKKEALKVSRSIAASGLSLIACMSEDTAVAMNGLVQGALFVRGTEDDMDVDSLDEFPLCALIKSFLSYNTFNTRFRNCAMPAIETYCVICDMLGIGKRDDIVFSGARRFKIA